MAGLSILILFVASVARGINSPMPALPEKNGRRVAAASCSISSGGHKKIIKIFFKKIGKSVTLFKLFSILYMNKKIGKKNERQNAESA